MSSPPSWPTRLNGESQPHLGHSIYLHEIFQLSSAAAASSPSSSWSTSCPWWAMGSLLIVALDRSLHTPMYFFICQPLLGRALVHHSHRAQNAGQLSQFPRGHLQFPAASPSTTSSSLWLPQNSSFSPPWPMTTMRPSADRSTTHCCSALQTCGTLACICWCVWDSLCPCSLHSSLHRSPSCTPNQINHFFCDADQIFRLSCTDFASHDIKLWAMLLALSLS